MNQDHSLHQTDLPVKIQILNISVNMARMGELVLRYGDQKSELLGRFLDQTESYLKDLDSEVIAKSFKGTLNKFSLEFKKLKKDQISSANKMLWAERAITWADILQIRSKLI